MLSSKQQEFLDNCSRRWNVKTGATGSGKTWLDYAVVIPQRLLALRGEGAAVILGNTQGTPYVPASPDRTLEFSAQVSTEIGSGQVIWNTPYAHYQYMGIVYGPNFQVLIKGALEWRSYKGRPKHPTDRELTYDTSQNPMAGPHWFERAKADQLNEWLDEARRVMIQGG